MQVSNLVELTDYINTQIALKAEEHYQFRLDQGVQGSRDGDWLIVEEIVIGNINSLLFPGKF